MFLDVDTIGELDDAFLDLDERVANGGGDSLCITLLEFAEAKRALDTGDYMDARILRSFRRVLEDREVFLAEAREEADDTVYNDGTTDKQYFGQALDGTLYALDRVLDAQKALG